MLKTIKSKFITLILLVVTISVGVPIFFLMYQFRENFHERSLIMLESALDVTLSGLNNCMNAQGKKNVSNVIERVAESVNIDHIRIYNSEGVILHSTENVEVGKNIKMIAPHHMSYDSRQIELLGEKGVYSVSEPILNETSCQNCHDPDKKVIAYLDLDTKLTTAERYFYTGSMHTIFLGIAILILLYITFYFLFNKLINKPLQSFIFALEKVEGGNLDVRLPEKKEDEFGKIDKHFNRMVKNIKESRLKIEELHSEQLQHADKLVTLGELTAEIAHEINNPTAIILSRADYLGLEIEDNSELAKFKEDIQTILNQTEKISKITSNILRYGRKLTQDFKTLKISDVIDQSLLVVNPKISQKRLSIEKEYGEKENSIYADSLQLEQLIINLLTNAVDASEPNDKIVLRCYQNPNNKIVLEIQDFGSGMDDETRQNIFSLFFTTKSEKKGTGLGLYIVKNICENLNAQIECISSQGKGTTFKVYFEKDKSEL